MKIKVRTNLVGGILFSIISVIIWLLIPSEIQVGNSTTTLIDARFIPQVMMVMIFVFSLVLIIMSLKDKKYEKYIELDLSKQLKVLIFYLMLIAYVLLIPVLSYVWSSILFCGGMLLYFKARKWTWYAISFSVVLFLAYVFSSILNVPLP